MLRIPVLLMILVLAACGSDSVSPEPDPGPATGPATFAVDGVPDLAVVHSGRDGALLGQAVTDAEGRATLDISAGDMLTIVLPSSVTGGRSRIYTYGGVQPGDTLRTEFVPIQAAPGEAGRAGGDAQFLTLQGEYPAHDLAKLTIPCRLVPPSSFPYTFQLPVGCADWPLDIKMETRIQVGNDYVADKYAYFLDVQPDPSGTTVVDFTGQWREDWQEVTFASPLPGFTTRDVSLVLRPFREGWRYQNLGEWIKWEGASNPPTELVVPLPADFYDAMRIDVDHENFDGQWLEFQELIPMDATVTSVTPQVPPAGIGAFPESDFDGPGRPEMSWTLDRGGIEGDAVELCVYWSVGKDGYAWFILLPPDAQSFQIPELPAELADIMPPAPDEQNRLSITIEFQDSSFVDGYDDRRNRYGFEDDVIRNFDDPGTELTVGAYFDTGFGVDKRPREPVQ